MRTAVTAFAAVLLACAGGCNPNQQDRQNRALTSGAVKDGIVKGTTSQAEVLKILGTPNIVSRGRDGKDVWTYDRVSTDVRQCAAGVAGGLVRKLHFGAEDLDGGLAAATGASAASRRSVMRTFTLIVEFDEKDLVKDYSLMTTAF